MGHIFESFYEKWFSGNIFKPVSITALIVLFRDQPPFKYHFRKGPSIKPQFYKCLTLHTISIKVIQRGGVTIQ
jgi:hypothetical protein